MSARGSVAVVARGAVSALGRGVESASAGEIGEPARIAIAHDAALAARGFLRPNTARAPIADEPGTDRALVLLRVAFEELLASSTQAEGLLRAGRYGLCLGTSSGGMASAELLFRGAAGLSAEECAMATYFGPFRAFERELEQRLGSPPAVSTQLVTACAASTWALGVGREWLLVGAVDCVIAGGYDALTEFVAAGFEALRATTKTLPAPFRVGRDGMSVGEGAGLVLLTREPTGARFFVSGFGASTDAVHITAPDRTGDGLLRAAARAMHDAGALADDIDVVSAHATATPYNDPMEATAIRAALGPRAELVPVHPFKAQIGHTLGAAGVLEALALGDAIARGVAPAAAGEGELDPEARVLVLPRAEARPMGAGLKLSAAFGGANAALVLTKDAIARAAAAPRQLFVARAEPVTRGDVARVAAKSTIDRDKIARADEQSLLCATAIAALDRSLAGAGILVGSALATLELNQRYYQRILERGPTAAEPRLFPPTSPNLIPGQVAIFFGLTGPSAALTSGPGHATDPLELACLLVGAGVCDRIVVAAYDVVGPISSLLRERCYPECSDLETGAVAALVSCDPADGAAVDRDEVAALRAGFGHLGLLRALRVLLPNG